MHEHALEIIRKADLCQLVHESTHRLGNTLDLVLVNRCTLDEVYMSSTVLPYISDHKMILVEIEPQNIQQNHSSVTSQRKYLNFEKADFHAIAGIFDKLIPELQESKVDSIEAIWRDMDTAIKSAVEMIPAKLARPKGHPWINRNIVRLIRKLTACLHEIKGFPVSSMKSSISNYAS